MKIVPYLMMIYGLAAMWSCSDLALQGSGEKPDENRFVTSILSQPGSLDEPMAFTFLSIEEMLIVERKGGVKWFNVRTREMYKVAQVRVNTIYTDKEGRTRAAEEGLMGVIAHPYYSDNKWVFLHYADPEEPKHVLARYVYKDDSLYHETKKIVLEYPVQREVCCHTGGGMVFDNDGNLYLTTGNNTANPPAGTSNLDERPGFENADDQRTAGNSNDFRGKIIRIHPEDDGSYTIPEGNLFPEGMEGTLPEIYTMGHRNPWRISIDSKTGYIYWGEVGPDASEDSELGPQGYDEFNQAKGPGFFGWPYFIGDNQAYADYDFENDSIGSFFDPENVINDSPNNTGIKELPKPIPAMIWYPYSYSEEFPRVGSAGRSATGGPVFRQGDFPESDKRFPAYYEGKWLIAEFMRGWIMSVSMDEQYNFVSMEPFLPGENFSSAIDMQFSPDGDLYVLEYGSAWFRGNDNAQVKQIRYNGGNRIPIAMVSADKFAGAVPLTVQLSSEGSTDYDNDPLTFSWSLSSANGFSEELEGTNPQISLEEPGVYMVELTVSDDKGNFNKQSLEIVAGNEPPQVDIVLDEVNRSFFFANSSLSYEVIVNDEEDGDTRSGDIDPASVAINFDYAPESFDLIEIAQNHKASDDWVELSSGKVMIGKSDCLSCHREDVQSIGPSYLTIAQTYGDDDATRELLSKRIINGSVGIWGEHAMSAHPGISEEDAGKMVDYILSLDKKRQSVKPIPLKGTYVAKVPSRESGRGGYLLRAAYQDKGGQGSKPLFGEKIIALRNPVVNAESFDFGSGTQLLTTPGRSFNVVEDGGYVGLANLDFTGISTIEVNAEAPLRNGAAGGVIEVRLDSPEGQMVGSTGQIEAVDIDFRAELEKLREAWEQGGRKGPRPGFRTVRELFQPKYEIPVSGIEGFHDVYFVIKNPGTKPGQILLQLNTFTFKPAKPFL